MDNLTDLTPLDPRYKSMMRANGGIFSAFLLIAATAGEILLDGWTGVFWIPALLIALLLVWPLPGRRYRVRGYDLGLDQLRTVQGVWLHSDITVPFGRVQHIDVEQGPLERAHGLATLVLHTAGTDNASISLVGLAHEDALSMRDHIRDIVRTKMV